MNFVINFLLVKKNKHSYSAFSLAHIQRRHVCLHGSDTTEQFSYGLMLGVRLLGRQDGRCQTDGIVRLWNPGEREVAEIFNHVPRYIVKCGDGSENWSHEGRAPCMDGSLHVVI